MMPAETDSNGRYVCTPEKPMPKDAPGRWAHTGAVSTGSSWDDLGEYYKCRDCGHTWEEELAQ